MKIKSHVTRFAVQNYRVVYPFPSHVVDKDSYKSVKVHNLEVDKVHPVAAKMLMFMPGFNIEMKGPTGKIWSFARGDGYRTAPCNPSAV